jgi:S-adenosyl-L-methionine hydrolase (adenosine-forming)
VKSPVPPPAAAKSSGASTDPDRARRPSSSSSATSPGAAAGPRAQTEQSDASAPAGSTAPCITLTTDFGTRDGYVGAMKGRLATLAPGIPVVDISHDLPPQGVLEGAWCLRRAVPQFPHGSVHVAVVDPEVGGWRSALAVLTERHVLVGPDNGLLSLVARDDGVRRVIEIRDSPRWSKSASFDGLTLFVPVAAFLAQGGDPDEIGEDAEDLVSLPDPEPTRVGHTLIGQVLLSDRFGNCITNLHRSLVGNRAVERVAVQPGLEARLVAHYAELAGSGALGAVWNSDGLLELTLFGQSALERHGLAPGQPVRIFLAGG